MNFEEKIFSVIITQLYNFFLELMQAVTKNPRDALVVAKVLRRTSSLSNAGNWFCKRRTSGILISF
jgi:hypothetical protein